MEAGLKLLMLMLQKYKTLSTRLSEGQFYNHFVNISACSLLSFVLLIDINILYLFRKGCRRFEAQEMFTCFAEA